MSLRGRWRYCLERCQWRLAWLLPRKVALFAFVRVYGCTGHCGPDYAPTYDAWERGAGR